MTTFGQRLLSELRDAGFSQSEFAKAVGTYPCNMSQWINGTVSPTAPSIRKILEALPGTDARWLLTGEQAVVTMLDLAKASGLDARTFCAAWKPQLVPSSSAGESC